MIVALENEDIAAFASPLYARSFLRQYSEYLQVPEVEWVDALGETEFVPENDVIPVIECDLAPARIPASDGHEPRNVSAGPSWVPVLGFVGVSALMIAALMIFFQKFDAKLSGAAGTGGISENSSSAESAQGRTEGEVADPAAPKTTAMTNNPAEEKPLRAIIVREN